MNLSSLSCSSPHTLSTSRCHPFYFIVSHRSRGIKEIINSSLFLNISCVSNEPWRPSLDRSNFQHSNHQHMLEKEIRMEQKFCNMRREIFCSMQDFTSQKPDGNLQKQIKEVLHTFYILWQPLVKIILGSQISTFHRQILITRTRCHWFLDSLFEQQTIANQLSLLGELLLLTRYMPNTSFPS